MPNIFSLNNHFCEALPGDPESKNTRRQVFDACYSLCKPKMPSNPKLLAYSLELAEQLGIDEATCQSATFREALSGQQVLPGTTPYACCYGGHQFGNWAGQLGDGRAINLGELADKNQQLWTLQLKGAGETPYSRTADGLAVLRSSLREYLCSEAMHHLGVPTTRALSLIQSGDHVIRDLFYDGNAKPEPGAIVCRAAPSFLRFGSLEIFAARQDKTRLTQLLNYIIEYHFPALLPTLKKSPQDAYLHWFESVSEKTLTMVIHWLRVGFVHGVMNTDNMSILGLTIDYGPYGWLDNFQKDWTPNTTDLPGKRYCYANQAAMCQWNLLQLANALLPVVESTSALETLINDFGRRYQDAWRTMMANKLGFSSLEKSDEPWLKTLENLLEKNVVDFTLFFHQLEITDFSDATSTSTLLSSIEPALYEEENIAQSHRCELEHWLKSYATKHAATHDDEKMRKERMNQSNPKFILRNCLTQVAIEQAEKGDYSEIETLVTLLKTPYQYHEAYQKYYGKRPHWAKHKPGCSALSCSS